MHYYSITTVTSHRLFSVLLAAYSGTNIKPERWQVAEMARDLACALNDNLECKLGSRNYISGNDIEDAIDVFLQQQQLNETVKQILDNQKK
jgi:hypothetical protein